MATAHKLGSLLVALWLASVPACSNDRLARVGDDEPAVLLDQAPDDETPCAEDCPLDCEPGTHLDAGATACVPSARVVDCGTPPPHAHANTATTITQHYVDGVWLPPVDSSYSQDPVTDQCAFACDEGYAWSGVACEESVVARDHVDCVHVSGQQGEDLYWIDSSGQPTELFEDCGYFGHSLNCAGVRMERDGQARAAALGLNSEAFLGCCGPNASTIDLYGCLPFAQPGEPCFDDVRHFNRCVDGYDCRNVPVGSYPQSCQPI